MAMAKTFFRNLSWSTLQLIINQFLGLLIFYCLSAQLDKSSFGSLNWALSILLTAFALLTLGMDQIMVKKIAENDESDSIFTIYTVHTFLTGLLFCALLSISWLLFPTLYLGRSMILILAVGKLFIFLSTPFKLMATGKEIFSSLFLMSISGNLLKSIAFLLLSFLGQVSINQILLVFVISEFAELFICIKLHPASGTVRFRLFNRKKYQTLLSKHKHQTGANIFSIALARMDWILIGWLLNSVSVAEYSFTYKAYEVATFPYLALAPLLVPAFIKLKHKEAPGEHKIIKNLPFIGIFLGGLIALILNIVWSPLIDSLTNHKYGTVNSQVILILSACVPVFFLNNFFWSIHFSLGNNKMIFRIFAFTFVLNLLSDLLLIPIFGNSGAAAGFLISMVFQTAFYIIKTGQSLIAFMLKPLMLALSFAWISWYINLFPNFLVSKLLSAIFIYMVLTLLLFLKNPYRLPAEVFFPVPKATD